MVRIRFVDSGKLETPSVLGSSPVWSQQEGRAGRGHRAEAAPGELRTHTSESNPWASVQKNKMSLLPAHVWFGQLPRGRSFYTRRREPQSSDMLALGAQNYPPCCAILQPVCAGYSLRTRSSNSPSPYSAMHRV